LVEFSTNYLPKWSKKYDQSFAQNGLTACFVARIFLLSATPPNLWKGKK